MFFIKLNFVAVIISVNSNIVNNMNEINVEMNKILDTYHACRMRNWLGEPGKGFHSVRIYGFALFDIIGWLFVSALFARWVKIPFWKSALGWLFLGIILHYNMCVHTALNMMLSL